MEAKWRRRWARRPTPNELGAQVGAANINTALASQSNSAPRRAPLYVAPRANAPVARRPWPSVGQTDAAAPAAGPSVRPADPSRARTQARGGPQLSGPAVEGFLGGRPALTLKGLLELLLRPSPAAPLGPPGLAEEHWGGLKWFA